MRKIRTLVSFNTICDFRNYAPIYHLRIIYYHRVISNIALSPMGHFALLCFNLFYA